MTTNSLITVSLTQEQLNALISMAEAGISDSEDNLKNHTMHYDADDLAIIAAYVATAQTALTAIAKARATPEEAAPTRREAEAALVDQIARMTQPEIDPDDGMPDDGDLCDSFATLMQLIDEARKITETISDTHVAYSCGDCGVIVCRATIRMKAGYAAGHLSPIVDWRCMFEGSLSGCRCRHNFFCVERNL